MLTAKDIMTTELITVLPDCDIAAAAIFTSAAAAIGATAGLGTGTGLSSFYIDGLGASPRFTIVALMVTVYIDLSATNELLLGSEDIIDVLGADALWHGCPPCDENCSEQDAD